MVKLEDTRPTVNGDLPLQSDVINATLENEPKLSVLVAEVDQTGDVEKELDEIVQHQQDQTQAVQTEWYKNVISINCSGCWQHRYRDHIVLSLLCENSHFKM